MDGQKLEPGIFRKLRHTASVNEEAGRKVFRKQAHGAVRKKGGFYMEGFRYEGGKQILPFFFDSISPGKKQKIQHKVLQSCCWRGHCPQRLRSGTILTYSHIYYKEFPLSVSSTTPCVKGAENHVILNSA